MKKQCLLIAFLGLQFICLAQVPSNVKILKTKKIVKDDPSKDKIVSYEFTFTQITVAEAARNKIDNNDCRQTWGHVSVFFYELDANGQINDEKRIRADFGEEVLFNKNVRATPFWSKSYYQDRRGVSNDEYIKRVSVRVSENLVKNRRIVALVQYQMQTAHKDNDLATFDHLEMTLNKAIFYLEDIPSKEESISGNTNYRYTIDANSIHGNGGDSDDSHRIWLHFTIKKKI